MPVRTLEATAIVRRNSIAFIDQVLALNDARRPLVMVADETQAGSLPGIVVDRCINPPEQSGWYRAAHPLVHDDLPAQVSYTSGTEGLPKAIVLTHANLADAAERIIAEMRMTSGIREYVGVPATFSFGMGRYRAISAVGGQAYLPIRGFDPLELVRMLAAGQVNALSAVPTLLRILLDAPDLIGAAGRNLRWMEIGSQPMTADEKLRIRAMFPGALIVQHYGLTEASRSTFLRISEVPEQRLQSVGRPVGRTEIALGPDNRIRIRGPHVARWRIDAEGLHDLRDADGWLQTNDLGHMQDGDLYFDGRADDLINCGGVKVSPDQLEARIRVRLEPGRRIAVAKVPDVQRGDGILVAVEAAGPSAVGRVKELAVAALQDMGVAAGGALHVMAVDTLPVTGTGKVQRRVLAERFGSLQPATPQAPKAAAGEIGDVISLFRHEFPGQTVRAVDSFESLGGDSLRYIQFSLSFEQRFGQLPDNWETLTATVLQGHIGTKEVTIWRRMETATVLRAFFMVCIVALHTNAFVYSQNWGAAYFLVLLAGYSVARFQIPEIIRTGSTRTLWGTVRYVAIPAFVTVLVLQIATRRFEILPLLLASNYLDPHTLKGYTLYFTEFYIQLLVIMAITMSFKVARNAFEARPMLSSVALLMVSVTLDYGIESVWNGDYNFHRTPWNYGWAFVLGIVLANAKDFPRKLLALSIATSLTTMKFGATSATYYVVCGYFIMLFFQSVSVPAPIKVVIGEMAAASLFIYLNHYVTISFVRKELGSDMPWTDLILAIVFGIALARIYAWTSRHFVVTAEKILHPDGRRQYTRNP